MKGLIIKDLISLKGQSKVLLVLAGFYLFIAITSDNPAVFGGIVSVVCATLPITTMALDERVSWDRYALTTPVSRSTIVFSKYLLGIILTVAANIANAVYILISKGAFSKELIYFCLAPFGLGLLIMSFVLPLIFKFGVEKGRLLLFIVILTPTALSMLFTRSGISISNEVLNILPFAVPIAIILLFVCSVFLSLRFYSNKDIR